MLSALVDNWLKPAGGRLLPVLCHACGGESGGAPMCRACIRTLPWNEPACRACALPLHSSATDVCAHCLQDSPPFDHAWAAFRYETPVTQQIVGLKFHAQLAPAHVLGELMAARLALRARPLPELLIPVPLHAGRLRRRGYNQALEIARALSKRLSVPLAREAARRLRPTPEQSRLSAVQRRRNLRGAFSVNATVRGRHIVLLDDVITTGATLAELTRAARRAGAARIEVWAAARTV